MGVMGVTFQSLRPMLRTKNLQATVKGSFYFSVDDVASLWADLKDRVDIAYPMEEFHYGMREFAIYDNNGYMLQFGTPTRG